MRGSLIVLTVLLGCGPQSPDVSSDGSGAEGGTDNSGPTSGDAPACAEPGVRLLLASEDVLSGFVVHDGLVYFSASDSAEIRRVDSETGEVEVLATDVVTTALAVGDDSVYWRRAQQVDDDDNVEREAAIMRMPIDGGDSIELARSSTQLGLIAAEGSDVFWEDRVDGCTAVLRHLSAGAGEPRELREFPGFVGELHTQSGLVFGVAAGCDLGPSAVWGARLDGEDPVLPWRPEDASDQADAVAVTTDFVYWSTPFPSIVYRTERATGEAEQVWAVESDSAVVAIAADEARAYGAMSDGSVFVVSHEGSAPEFLAQSDGVANWIVADDGSVVWTTRDYAGAFEFSSTLFVADASCL